MEKKQFIQLTVNDTQKSIYCSNSWRKKILDLKIRKFRKYKRIQVRFKNLEISENTRELIQATISIFHLKNTNLLKLSIMYGYAVNLKTQP